MPLFAVLVIVAAILAHSFREQIVAGSLLFLTRGAPSDR